MGELFLHDLKPLIDKYGCSFFLETGTGIGTGLEHAQQYPFKRLYSIEINRELYGRCSKKFKDDDKVYLFGGESTSIIPLVLTREKGKPGLFWLDAHFPGADFQLGDYDDKWPETTKLPLQYDLAIIAAHGGRHVIIIDDLQLYEPGQYEIPYPPKMDKFKRDGSFIQKMFKGTHNFRRDYRHQGFLILEPK